MARCNGIYPNVVRGSVVLSIVEVSACLRPDLLQGTLDLLILKTIATGPLHGWAVAKRLQVLSGEVLAVPYTLHCIDSNNKAGFAPSGKTLILGALRRFIH